MMVKKAPINVTETANKVKSGPFRVSTWSKPVEPVVKMKNAMPYTMMSVMTSKENLWQKNSSMTYYYYLSEK